MRKNSDMFLRKLKYLVEINKYRVEIKQVIFHFLSCYFMLVILSEGNIKFSFVIN